MIQRREIEFPFSGFDTCTYRAFQEPDAIHLDRERALNPRERVGFALSLALSVLPLAAYLLAVLLMAVNGVALSWVAHVLALGFALAFLALVGYMTIEFERYQGSTLTRDNDGTLLVRYRWRGGRERTYRLEEPATLVALLDRGSGPINVWRNVNGDSGADTRERFNDVVQVELELHAATVSGRGPLRSTQWIKWMPRYMEFYHRERDPDANIKATVDALRPLADAVRDGVGIPVEFRLIGGALVERIEGGSAKGMEHSDATGDQESGFSQDA